MLCCATPGGDKGLTQLLHCIWDLNILQAFGMQTLPMMHQDARIAHMYISSGTIVIRSNATAATFDDLRVMDLLFAQQFESGPLLVLRVC